MPCVIVDIGSFKFCKKWIWITWLEFRSRVDRMVLLKFHKKSWDPVILLCPRQWEDITWVSIGYKGIWGIQQRVHVCLMPGVFIVCVATLHDPVCPHGMVLNTGYIKEFGTLTAWQENIIYFIWDIVSYSDKKWHKILVLVNCATVELKPDVTETTSDVELSASVVSMYVCVQ
jgi:hypothetical protein